MPGTAAQVPSKDWFKKLFGFAEFEGETAYEDTRRKFKFDPERQSLVSRPNQRQFHVGPFEVPTLEALRIQCDEAVDSAPGSYWTAGALRFENVVGNAYDLHLDQENSGAVFQVMSLFNCLETVFGHLPEDGVQNYAARPVQGAAAALACPAATIFRNYFVNGNGQGDGRELDCLGELGRFVQNEQERYWTLHKGYCMPIVPEVLAKFSQMIVQDPSFGQQVEARVQVGVHWDTEVRGGSHRVCQVFCSTLPTAHMKQRPVTDWAGFAGSLLEAAFDATLTVATTLAAKRGTRVKVYLTELGGGEFGNRRRWIVDALNKALCTHERRPLDVVLVHFAKVPEEYTKLEVGRGQGNALSRSRSGLSAVTPKARRASVQDLMETFETHDREAEGVVSSFKLMDLNGDGIIDRKEFMKMLHSIDEDFFSQRVVDILFAEADCDGDGDIHYSEFVNWIFNEDEDIRNKLIGRALAHPAGMGAPAPDQRSRS